MLTKTIERPVVWRLRPGGTCPIFCFRRPLDARFQPDAYVDIDEHLGLKLAALECHDSQVRGSLLVEPDGPATARYLGLQARLRNAEGFVPLRMAVAL